MLNPLLGSIGFTFLGSSSVSAASASITTSSSVTLNATSSGTGVSIDEESIYNDLFGTRGQIDGKLIDKELIKDNQKIVYIGSNFPYQNGIGDKDTLLK